MRARNSLSFFKINSMRQFACRSFTDEEFTAMQNEQIRKLELRVKSLEQALCRTSYLLSVVTKDNPEMRNLVADEIAAHRNHRNEEHNQLIKEMEEKLEKSMSQFHYNLEKTNALNDQQNKLKDSIDNYKSMLNELKNTKRDESFLNPDVTEKFAKKM